MLGTMPHKAPLVYSVIRLKLPGLSRYSQTSTIRPVKGITAISPANVGSLRPIPVQKTIMHKLINNLIRNRIFNIFLPNPPKRALASEAGYEPTVM